MDDEFLEALKRWRKLYLDDAESEMELPEHAIAHAILDDFVLYVENAPRG